ncbi:hypothetical protein N7456_009269 [Penicillium angulare]|uniref:Rhodopsin domain-containing protein n=1 Tax=Penicillium angulare TaxID=116970 RepID=A0A9W9F4A9_9EURO|nr:hypothetical protein N7456_009269 [Penicillium angulare]
MSSSKPWPSGVSAPLTVNNDNDHSGLIVVLTAVCLCLHILAVVAVIFSSFQKSTLPPGGYAFAALVTTAIIQAALVFAGVHFGWGTKIESIETSDKDKMLKIIYSAEILSILVLGLSKSTVCIFYEALFSHMQRRFIRTLLLGTIAWTLLSVFLVAIRCTSSPWNEISDSTCSSLFQRWEAVTIIDIFTEVFLLGYVILAIFKVMISTKQKILVICALGSRIILIPLAAVRLHFVKIQLDSAEPTLLGSFATVCTEIYLALSVSCFLTAFLKPFIAVYENDNGISYTYKGPSESESRAKFQSRLRPGPEDSEFRIHPRSGSRAESSRGWEREEDPIINKSNTGRGLHILKTVQLSVDNESMELSERGGSSL